MAKWIILILIVSITTAIEIGLTKLYAYLRPAWSSTKVEVLSWISSLVILFLGVMLIKLLWG